MLIFRANIWFHETVTRRFVGSWFLGSIWNPCKWPHPRVSEKQNSKIPSLDLPLIHRHVGIWRWTRRREDRSVLDHENDAYVNPVVPACKLRWPMPSSEFWEYFTTILSARHNVFRLNYRWFRTHFPVASGLGIRRTIFRVCVLRQRDGRTEVKRYNVRCVAGYRWTLWSETPHILQHS